MYRGRGRGETEERAIASGVGTGVPCGSRPTAAARPLHDPSLAQGHPMSSPRLAMCGWTTAALALSLSALPIHAQGGIDPGIPGPKAPAALVQQTRAAFRSAYLIVLGRPATDYDLGNRQPIGTCDVTDPVHFDLCLQDSHMQWEAVNFSQAVATLKLGLLTPNAQMERAAVIDRAYYNAFGRASTADEQLYWENRMRTEKLWYAPVATAALAYLNAPANRQTERAATVNRVYQTVFGRDADAGNRAYWLPRTEHFGPMVQANRSWLYSPAGAAELPSMVRRSVAARLGREGSEAEVKAALIKAMLNHATYDEMLSLP
jgi:hypothetical protein